jgi:tRNA (cmo5U34)-methyltransferase
MAMKASAEEIRERFERAVEYLSDLERGQTAIMDAPLALDLVARAASAVTPHAPSARSSTESKSSKL